MAEPVPDASPTTERTHVPEPEASQPSRLLGTFSGVYRPTVLTILGVMMYLREGWLVGHAGLFGGMLIICLIFLITGTTALALSSIATNTRVGPGGVFAIISRSMGLETGGSIGLPLYVGQALSAALYIYGFSEMWLYLFPSHPQLLVVYSIFAIGFGTAFISTRLAFRLQGIVMLVILASLGSILLGLTSLGGATELQQPTLWGSFEAGGFWTLFAVFFPAGTGIMVGASMSGALANSRRSIPRGTLAAVGTALGVYLLLAVWYSLVATPQELVGNVYIVIERAAVPEVVMAGILASTFTATLSTLVAAPYTLQALGQRGVLPGCAFIGETTADDMPRNATLVNGGLVAAALLLGSLNRVAMLITMFFLLTYLSINLVVLIEQALNMPSFRPRFRVSLWVPAVGAVGCLVAIFVISATFGLIALGVVLATYVYLSRRELVNPWETVRSSIFVSLADWAVKRIDRSPDELNERAWKPDLLVPVTSRTQVDGVFRFLRVLAQPKGSLKLLGIEPPTTNGERVHRQGDAPWVDTPRLDTLRDVAREFRDLGLTASSVSIEAPSFAKGIEQSVQIMWGGHFPPNILFGFAHHYGDALVARFPDIASAHHMGTALLFEHPEAGLGHERRLNVWVREQHPEWELGLRLANLDLSILLAYQIYCNWHGPIRLLMACTDEEMVPAAHSYLEQLTEDARLPSATTSEVLHCSFDEAVHRAPRADLSIFGLRPHPEREHMQGLVTVTGSSCLFVRDSDRESALA